MNVQIHPHMTVEQLAAILDQHKGSDVESYIRIETIKGKPVGYLVREPRIPISDKPGLLRRQGN